MSVVRECPGDVLGNDVYWKKEEEGNKAREQDGQTSRSWHAQTDGRSSGQLLEGAMQAREVLHRSINSPSLTLVRAPMAMAVCRPTRMQVRAT